MSLYPRLRKHYRRVGGKDVSKGQKMMEAVFMKNMAKGHIFSPQLMVADENMNKIKAVKHLAWMGWAPETHP